MSLEIAVASAELTNTFADDLKALRAEDKWLDERIKIGTGQERQLRALEAQAGVRSKITDILRQEKDDAQKMKSTPLDKLDLFKSTRDNSRALTDARANLALQNQIGGPEGIKLATRELEDAKLERQRLALQGGTYSFAKGNVPQAVSGMAAGAVYITINGTHLSVAELTRAVRAAQQRGFKKTSSQTRGRHPGQQPY